MNCKHCKAQWTAPQDKSLSKCPFCNKPLIDPTTVGDNASPDIILQQVVEQFDVEILGDRRLSAILSDFMPHVERRYLNIFRQAVQEGIGARLLELTTEDEAIRTATIHTIKSSFRQNNGFDHTADYVVDCFLFSMGWIEEVKETKTSINESAIEIIKSQLEEAMADGCLSTDETALIFSLGSQLNLSETTTSQIINDALKQKGFKPSNKVEKSIKNPKDILCLTDWATEDYLKTHSKQTAQNQANRPIGFASVTIGKQVWMKYNLNVDRFRNGDPIPHVTSDKEWAKAETNKQPAWCYYDNDPENGKKYGKLYNWHAVNDPRGLAPEGWHIPSYGEWTELIDFLGGEETAGNKLKSTNGWYVIEKDEKVIDEFGFSALPGGYRSVVGTFKDLGFNGNWWTSTEKSSRAWRSYLTANYGIAYCEGDSHGKEDGFSVRCLRNIK